MYLRGKNLLQCLPRPLLLIALDFQGMDMMTSLSLNSLFPPWKSVFKYFSFIRTSVVMDSGFVLI